MPDHWRHLTNLVRIPGNGTVALVPTAAGEHRFYRSIAPRVPALPRPDGFTERWEALWALPAAPASTPLVLKKVVKGEKTERATTSPLQALVWQPLEKSGRFWARPTT